MDPASQETVKDSFLRFPRALAVPSLLALVVLLGIYSVFAGMADHFPGDVGFSQWVQSGSTPWLDGLMKAVSFLGTRIPAIIATAILVAGVTRALSLREGAFLAIPVTITFGVNVALKHLIDRPRPDPAIVRVMAEVDTSSFPSAHAMHATVLIGMLALLIYLHLKPERLKMALLAFLFLFWLATGFSRIYLGVHWFSDVMGGYLWGLALLALAVKAYRSIATRYRGS